MNATHQIERQYAGALQAHGTADFSFLYEAYSPALYGYLLRLVNEPTRAQDLLQDAFIKIWSSSQQYDPQLGSVFTWMLSVTRTVAIESLSTGQVRATTFIPDQPALIGTTVTLASSAGQSSPLHAVPNREVGQHQQPASGTVKTRLRNGLLQLKKQFSPSMDQYIAGSQAL